MNNILSALQQFSSEESGVASVEYAFLAAFIAAVVAATVVVIGMQTKSTFCILLTSMNINCP